MGLQRGRRYEAEDWHGGYPWDRWKEPLVHWLSIIEYLKGFRSREQCVRELALAGAT